jgi:hypothetical protein
MVATSGTRHSFAVLTPIEGVERQHTTRSVYEGL